MFPKLKRKHRSSLKKAKDKAVAIFSLFIRNKNSQNGLAECYTCGRWHEIKEMDAGHGIAGRNNAVLFMEEVVRPQCKGCNIWGHGQYRIFTLKLIKELGMKRYEELAVLSNETVKFSEEKYLEIYELYKKKFEQLEVPSAAIFLRSRGLN